MTLLEILVVLALVGILMGLGIGGYLRLGRQGVWQAEVGRVLSAINRVRNASRAHPAALEVMAGDPEKGLNGIRGMEFDRLFYSQCEPPEPGEDAGVLQGAMDRNGSLPGGVKFENGVIGKCLDLGGVGAVDCGDHPAYDVTDGISISLWVFPSSLRGGTLVQRGPNLGVSLVPAGDALTVLFELGLTQGKDAAPGKAPSSAVPESHTYQPKALRVREKQWIRIVVAYERTPEGGTVTIAADQGFGPVEHLRVEEKGSMLAMVPSRGAELLLGGGRIPFHGMNDDVRIDGVIGEEPRPFAAGVKVLGPSRRIRFLSGKLDPARHQQAETIVLVSGDRRREIVIGLEGSVLEK